MYYCDAQLSAHEACYLACLACNPGCYSSHLNSDAILISSAYLFGMLMRRLVGRRANGGRDALTVIRVDDEESRQWTTSAKRG